MAKIVFISRSKPETDPRFQYLSKLINSLAPADEIVFLTLQLSTSALGKKPSWLAIIYTLFKITLHYRVKLIVYNDSDFKPFIVLYRMLFGTKSLYDQQENTLQNFLSSGRYRGWKLSTLLWITRLLNRHQGDTLHLLAEKVYVRELGLAGRPNLFLFENDWFEYLHIQHRNSSLISTNDDVPNFLLCGTLGPHYGTLDAVRWHLNQVRTGIRQTLTICGYAPWPAFRQELVKEIEGENSITLIGRLDQPRHPADIYQQMQKTNCMLLPYRINGSTRNRIPSKLREALALGTTVAITANPAWEHVLVNNGCRHFLLQGDTLNWTFEEASPSSYTNREAPLAAQTARLTEALRGVLAF